MTKKKQKITVAYAPAQKNFYLTLRPSQHFNHDYSKAADKFFIPLRQQLNRLMENHHFHPSVVELAVFQVWVRLITYNSDVHPSLYKIWLHRSAWLQQSLLTHINETITQSRSQPNTSDVTLMKSDEISSQDLSNLEPFSLRIPLSSSVLTPEEFKRQGKVCLEGMFLFSNRCLQRDIKVDAHLYALEQVFLYHWLLLHSVNSRFPKDFIVKAKSCWQEIFIGLYNHFIKKAEEATLCHGTEQTNTPHSGDFYFH